jgi:hypothetical protein
MATILALVVCTALALAFSSTRAIGILGTGILILMFPVATTLAMASAGIAYLIHQHSKGN